MTDVPSYMPGDMNKMFSSIVEKFGSTYDVNVLSTDPWVVTFDNFLTDPEAKALIQTVSKWERSTDTGTSNEFGETGSTFLHPHFYFVIVFSTWFMYHACMQQCAYVCARVYIHIFAFVNISIYVYV